MRQEFLATGTGRVIRSVAEKDVLPGSESNCIQRPVQRLGLRARMNAYGTEVGSESVFHLQSHTAIERLAAAARPRNCVFDRSGCFCITLSFPGQSQKPLDVTVAVISLKLKYGMSRSEGLTWRDPAALRGSHSSIRFFDPVFSHERLRAGTVPAF
jgi:hypothetical protein